MSAETRGLGLDSNGDVKMGRGSFSSDAESWFLARSLRVFGEWGERVEVGGGFASQGEAN